MTEPMHFETFTTTRFKQTRVRWAHVHTLRDGWRLSETTVELTVDDSPTEDDLAEVEALMTEIHVIGYRESGRRNHFNGQRLGDVEVPL